MKWKLRVRDTRGNIHTHRFCNAEAAWRHWVLYSLDAKEGYYEWIEMWKRSRDVVATGEQGEEVWQLQMRYPTEC